MTVRVAHTRLTAGELCAMMEVELQEERFQRGRVAYCGH